MLVLRSFALANAERRRTLDQIAVYGFRAVGAGRTSGRAMRSSALEELATATGEKALARFAGLRSGEKSVCASCSTRPACTRRRSRSFVGTRILAASIGAGVAVPARARGRARRSRSFLGGGLMTLMGWYLPYVRVQRRARAAARADRPRGAGARRPARDDGRGRRRLRAGLQLASRSIEGPLGQELRLALREQSLGLTPEEALRNLSLRVDSPATRAFTQALVQGESLGVSIGTILRDLATDMRKRRRQSAEERAQKTPTKILFPLIALILPAMFIVTLGPVVMEALDFLALGLTG